MKNFPCCCSSLRRIFAFVSRSVISVHHEFPTSFEFSSDTTAAQYTYNAQSQVVTEKLPRSSLEYTYNYDTGGNIRSAVTKDNGVQSTRTFSYTDSSWKDLLTAVDGHSLTYDAGGNPLTYYNGANWTFTWKNGRELATAASGDTSVSYTYDADGLRTSKTVNGVTHNYVYLGDLLIEETWGNNKLQFAYDEQNRPYSVKYNDNLYFYVLNLQGDVIRLVTGGGVTQGEYTYNAWGELVNVTAASAIGNVNPLRYRGYVYDSETEFYYTSSRYYDPANYRFINADDVKLISAAPKALTDKNLYAYCDNNSVMRVDDAGTFWNIVSGAIIGGVISAGVELTAQVIENKLFGTKMDWESVGMAALSGAAGGALAATGLGLHRQEIGNAIISGVSEAVSQVRSGNRNIGSIAANVGFMTAVGVLGGKIGGKGIRAEGTEYRKCIDKLNSLKGNVRKAISNPRGYK